MTSNRGTIVDPLTTVEGAGCRPLDLSARPQDPNPLMALALERMQHAKLRTNEWRCGADS